jgi:hypothetical protein
MRKKLRLVTVLKIKKHLESLIEETYKKFLKDNETETSIDPLLEKILKASEQLIIIKEAVQKANQGRHKTGRTNNYYIYKYSNLQTKKRIYSEINGVDPLACQISPDEARTDVRKINAELDTISTKLTNFNLRKRVQVVLDTSLELEPLLLE